MAFSLLSAAILACGFLVGLIPAIVDGIKKPLASRLNQPGQSLDGFVRVFYLTWLPAMPLAGWVLDSWNVPRELLFFSLIGVVGGFAGMALARSVSALNGSAALLGAAYSALTTTAIRLMATGMFADERPLYGAALNLGFIAVGAGAMAGPWAVNAIERWWGCRQGLLYLGLACLAPALLTVLCERKLFPKSAESLGGIDDILTHPHLALLAGAILLYFAMENCLDYWPDPYLKELGYRPTGARLGLLAFWLAFLGMRAAAAWWFYDYPGQVFAWTVALLIISAVVLGNLSGGYEVGGGTLGFWLVGACYGPLLPGFLAIAFQQAESTSGKPLSAALLGGLLALSGFDTLVVRPAMDRLTKDRRARFVMRVPTVLAIVVAAPMLLLALL